ncbi:hypothetical protein C8Q76DRAFT_722547 [Earliella scabrosa]|nr:hypothetical protein C8Q76DRAFT_722547 [Earliella scabrosa]
MRYTVTTWPHQLVLSLASWSVDTMQRSLVSLSPLVASSRLCLRQPTYGAWVRSRPCAATTLSTLSLRPSSSQALRLFQHRPSGASEQLIWQFVSNRILRATHRSGINSRASRGTGGGYGGGSRGPWDNFRDRINSIPQNAIFWGIIGLNGIVFATWNLAWVKYQSTGDPSSYIWMRDHFISSLDNLNSGRWYTLLTACFSHEDTMHLFFNGFTFYYMAPTVLAILGNVGFLGLYLGGGIFSSLVGIAWRKYQQPRAQAQRPGSHGASGAIYSIISFFACVAPTATFYVFGIVPLPAWAVVTGVFLWDGYSAVNQQREGTDTAGHIGGLLAGIGYFVAKRLRIM